MKKIILILLFIFSFLNADITQYFPKLEGRVVDEANLLSPLVKKDIDLILKEEEEKSSNQIVVVILNSLNGYTIEEYSYQLGRFWGIGQKDKNNGVLLVISMAERKIRIEVGYGLEGALTDKISHEIINYTIKPNFKANQYELGILKALNEIKAAIKGEYVAKAKTGDDFNSVFNAIIPLAFFALIFLSMIANSISKALRSQFLYKVTKSSIPSSFFGFFAYVSSQPFTTYNFLVALVIFVMVFVFNFIISKKVDFDKLAIENYTNSSNSSSGFGGFGSSSSSSGGFGGFSGGGGSFGGGGASGGW
ncbi:MAG: TPM domain-containing protein [Arcobacter sp.]|uniref:TPM domain-containing protein n=1 Tax=Arcobacter sp. TaxID=1872629 RepID=UPI00258EF6DE|nr:TPM domain-containing protein [Arcobacter sp.]MDD3007245.1 TPM domain-containing protein [Arcobacter sp.]